MLFSQAQFIEYPEHQKTNEPRVFPYIIEEIWLKHAIMLDDSSLNGSPTAQQVEDIEFKIKEDLSKNVAIYQYTEAGAVLAFLIQSLEDYILYPQAFIDIATKYLGKN